MIPRYAREKMVSIWSPETKFRIWFEIEAHAADALAELGVIPREAADKLWEAAGTPNSTSPASTQIEREVKHDVIAFLTHLSEIVGPEARFVHQGMTSSDVLDTCLKVQLARAADILIDDTDALLAALKKRAFEHKTTLTIGAATASMPSPPPSASSWRASMPNLLAPAPGWSPRARKSPSARFRARSAPSPYRSQGRSPCRREDGAKVEPISTQVIPRDRHAAYFAALGLVACSLERLATEIRHLQRTEVLEAEEYFSPGQKGSSAMPHKRNPVLSENLTGLARMVRAYVLPAMENVALWHERDISHSSVERYIGPDATVTLDFALRRLPVSSRISSSIGSACRRISKGPMASCTASGCCLRLPRPACRARRPIASSSATRWGPGPGRPLFDLLKADKEVTDRVPLAELEALFDLDYHLKQVERSSPACSANNHLNKMIFPAPAGKPQSWMHPAPGNIAARHPLLSSHHARISRA